MTKISAWLVSSCGVEAEKATLIETQIIDKYWITSVEALQEILDVMPEILEALKLPLPTTKLLRMKIGSFNCKRLETLAMREIEMILNQMFPDCEYAEIFANKKINGFVLSTVDSAVKLAQWGVQEPAHVDTLWLKLAHWKVYGVPLKYLESESSGSKRGRSESPVHGSSSSSTVGASVQVEPTHESLIVQNPSAQSVHESEASSPVAKKVRKSMSRELSALLRDKQATQKHSSKVKPMGLRGSRPSATGPGSNSAGATAIIRVRRTGSRELSSLLSDATTARLNTVESSAAAAHAATRSSPVPSRPTSASTSATSLPELVCTGSVESSAPKKFKAPAARAPASAPKVASPRSATALSTMSSKATTAPIPETQGDEGELLTMLDSRKKADQIGALKIYSRQAAKDPCKIKAMRTSGAFSRMLKIVSRAASTDEEVVWWSMVVLNNTIAIAPLSYTLYLVEQGIIPAVVPLVSSTSAKLRLQALWILGNLGVSDGEKGFKSLVTTPAIITDIVQSFWTIGRMSKGAPEAPLLRYAITLKQLTSDCTPAQSSLLVALAPVLREIIAQPACVTSFTSAVDAVCNLVATNEGTVVATLLKNKIVQALVGRLDDSKIKVVQYALYGLSALADGSNCHQMLELAPALPRLESLVKSASGCESNPKSSLIAIECVYRICQGGSQCVALVVSAAPTMFPSLLSIVRRAQELSKGQDLPGPNGQSRYAALALVSATQFAGAGDLEYLVGLGMYAEAFALLSHFADSSEVVQVTLQAISRILFKYEAVHDLQTRSEGKTGLRAEKAWASVRQLADVHLEAGSRERYTEQELMNSEDALKLWNTALSLELAVH